MLALKELQSCFQNYLMLGDSDPLSSSISHSEKLSQAKRLKIYFDSYRIRLFDILKLDFPKTHTLAGDDNFKAIFTQYLHQHPSTHFSVRYFGERLSEFLKNTPPYSEQGALAEMALFEWFISHTIDAKDEPHLTLIALSALPPEKWMQTAFTFHPSVVSYVFEWDVPQLWTHIDNELPPRTPLKQATPVRWLFWRKGIKSFFQSLSPLQEKMFHAIQNKLNFCEICEDLLDLLPEEEIPQFAAQTMHGWVNENMLVDIEQNATSLSERVI